MSVTVHTKIPRRLRRVIFESIRDGEITSWKIDEESHITLYNPMWRNRAWFYIAHIETQQSITFGIIGKKFDPMTMGEFGVYHGRLTEMILANFANIISGIEISASPTEDDIIN